ncbi:ATP-binding cassette domain-containing protein [Flavihumibacter petaseus]|uniref:Putative ABC transporter ATP-binding protein n=1 Tax=Flavihumibacter petaseus NBRC 106054 TaxID=1220578 RepID=A0A0E9MTP7_9BACT|nr:ATP-binding cassette domain-containing protein [Flavihumibacter petaseus]GAO41142.1 putative ABC transporter ATP-binding protein [Flavihumibacter petaseus NBRC 106054]
MTGITTIGNNINLRWQGKSILDNISFAWEPGSQVLLTGGPGSGKTLLTKAFTGELFHEGTLQFLQNGAPVKPRVIRVEQHYHFTNRSHVNSFYYQQRFNSTEADDAATIREELLQLDPDASKWMPMLEMFSMSRHLDAPLLHLSSGEHKRFQLVRAFLQAPQIMILDEPFTGMDAHSRKLLTDFLTAKVAEGMMFILICHADETPAFINTELFVGPGRMALGDFQVPDELQPVQDSFNTLIDMADTHIRYGQRTILENVNWTVKPGEYWWLKGANGSGKSTLLSLVTGDNPQAYANNMKLFDRQRGTGETIWDIKKNIGFVSPELQWYFDRTMTVYHTVASGWFDTIGLFRTLSTEQHQTVLQWLRAFDLLPEKDQPLSLLSTSRQRLALLARAMVKNPALLVLDEPCQGLSDAQQKAFTRVVEILCEDPLRSIIYVTHYENELPACIDHQIALSGGHAMVQEFSSMTTLTA